MLYCPKPPNLSPNPAWPQRLTRPSPSPLHPLTPRRKSARPATAKLEKPCSKFLILPVPNNSRPWETCTWRFVLSINTKCYLVFVNSLFLLFRTEMCLFSSLVSSPRRRSSTLRYFFSSFCFFFFVIPFVSFNVIQSIYEQIVRIKDNDSVPIILVGNKVGPSISPSFCFLHPL